MRRLPSVYPADNIAWPNRTGTFDIGAADAGSKILMRNLTPLNLRLDFYNGSTDILSAWEHNAWILDGDTQSIGWTIDSDSPSVIAPPSNVVYFTLFEAREQVPGTYPVFSVLQTSSGNTSGTGGTGTTNQLINTGNPAGQNVVTVNSTAATGSTVTLSTDGLFQLLVTITAALVNAIKTNATDPILQLGALTHLVEVLGNLKVDGTLAIVGSSSLDNGNITTNGAGTIAAAALKSNTFRDNTTGGDQIDLSPTGIKVNGTFALVDKKIADGSANNLADWTASGLYLKANPAANGPFHYQGDGTNTDFSISAISKFTGTGDGTFAHGLKVAGVGITPDIIIPVQNVAGSQTMGYSALGATNVTIKTGAGLSWTALAIKL